MKAMGQGVPPAAQRDQIIIITVILLLPLLAVLGLHPTHWSTAACPAWCCTLSQNKQIARPAAYASWPILPSGAETQPSLTN
jgi:hypothetical protein